MKQLALKHGGGLSLGAAASGLAMLVLAAAPSSALAGPFGATAEIRSLVSAPIVDVQARRARPVRRPVARRRNNGAAAAGALIGAAIIGGAIIANSQRRQYYDDGAYYYGHDPYYGGTGYVVQPHPYYGGGYYHVPRGRYYRGHGTIQAAPAPNSGK